MQPRILSLSIIQVADSLLFFLVANLLLLISLPQVVQTNSLGPNMYMVTLYFEDINRYYITSSQEHLDEK